MSQTTGVDTSFDVRSDSGGRDPDKHSPTLRRYHQLLWSKQLPNGVPFILDAPNRGEYLHHASHLGEFFLGSDTIVHTFGSWLQMAPIIAQVPIDDQEEFRRTGRTIGGAIVFPSNRIDGKPTINGARGMHPRIRDRFDLTLECIRRHYVGEASPLSQTLSRYDDFFLLFDDFRGYVDFFLLQDLVSADYGTVKFFTSFDNFISPALPGTVDDYENYRTNTVEFVMARNERMADSVQ